MIFQILPFLFFKIICVHLCLSVAKNSLLYKVESGII